MVLARPRTLFVTSTQWLPVTHLPSLVSGLSEVHVLTPKKHVVRWSRYVDRRFILPDGTGPALDALEAHLRAEGPYDWVQFGDDPLIFELLRDPSRHPLAAAWLPGKAEGLLKALDKTLFPSFCEDLGLAVPPWILCKGDPDDLQRALEALGPGPWVLKRSWGFSGVGLRKVTDLASTLAAWEELGRPETCLLQRWITGDTCACNVLTRRGTVVALAHQVAEERMYETGPSARRRPIASPEWDASIPLLVKNLELNGIVLLDGVREASTGRFLLLELNARAGNITHVTPPSRAAWGSFFNGSPRDSERYGRAGEPTCLLLPQDLMRIASTRDWKGLRDWLPGSGYRKDVPWHDPGLALRLSYTALRGMWREI